MKASSNLAFFIWTHELLPLDILILALIDRDDDAHALHIVVSFLPLLFPHITYCILFLVLEQACPYKWIQFVFFSCF